MIRDATRADAEQMAAVFAAVVPHLVRTAAWFRHDLDHPPAGGVTRRFVAEEDGLVVAAAGLGIPAESPDRARCWLTVHPDHRGNGVGSALLDRVVSLAREAGAEQLSAIADSEGRNVAFAEQHGFRLVRQHTASAIDPATAPAPAPVPAGMALVTCAELADESVRQLLNATAGDDPSGLSEAMSPPAFAHWWHGPDHRPELGAAVVDGGRPVSFTSVQVDLDRGLAFTAMTATDPAQRGRGLARLVKTASLRALAAAGVRSACTNNDDANEPVLAINRSLGYVPVVANWSVRLAL